MVLITEFEKGMDFQSYFPENSDFFQYFREFSKTFGAFLSFPGFPTILKDFLYFLICFFVFLECSRKTGKYKIKENT